MYSFAGTSGKKLISWTFSKQLGPCIIYKAILDEQVKTLVWLSQLISRNGLAALHVYAKLQMKRLKLKMSNQVELAVELSMCQLKSLVLIAYTLYP